MAKCCFLSKNLIDAEKVEFFAIELASAARNTSTTGKPTFFRAHISTAYNSEYCESLLLARCSPPFFVLIVAERLDDLQNAC